MKDKKKSNYILLLCLSTDGKRLRKIKIHKDSFLIFYGDDSHKIHNSRITIHSRNADPRPPLINYYNVKNITSREK